MAEQKVTITSPVARMVGGSLYEPQTKNAEGQPLTVRSGPKVGQPRVDYYIAIAIPKTPGQHWATEPWGRPIWETGNREFPQAAQSPTFAWKVKDGDSTVFNKRGKRPCDQPGHPGHWILSFSGGYQPTIYRMEGKTPIQVIDKDFIKPGDYVQVNFSVSGNKSQTNPGLFLNHNMVAFRGKHPDGEIVFGPNVEDAGFGEAPLPPGTIEGYAPAPVVFPQPPAAPAAVPTPPAAPSVPVVPNHAFVNGPAIPPVPAATPVVGVAASSIPQPPSAIATSPSRQMTALANGVSYETFIAKGWTDDLLVSNGYMTR